MTRFSLKENPCCEHQRVSINTADTSVVLNALESRIARRQSLNALLFQCSPKQAFGNRLFDYWIEGLIVAKRPKAVLSRSLRFVH